MSLMFAIYDKKSQTCGKPIHQQSVEEAIQGVKDALNSTNSMGEYLMPGHREHPEDYKLILIGSFDETAKAKYNFNEHIGKHLIIETPENTFIKIEERDIIEFKDIELKETNNKVSAESIYTMNEHYNKEIKGEINELIGMVKTIMGTNRSNNRSNRNIFRVLKK